ncbi:MAG: hypothetical protein WAL26_04475 [Mycobacterium sp.]
MSAAPFLMPAECSRSRVRDNEHLRPVGRIDAHRHGRADCDMRRRGQFECHPAGRAVRIAVGQSYVERQLMPAAQRGGRDILLDADDGRRALEAVTHQSVALVAQNRKLIEGSERLTLVRTGDTAGRVGLPDPFEPTHLTLRPE